MVLMALRRLLSDPLTATPNRAGLQGDALLLTLTPRLPSTFFGIESRSDDSGDILRP